MKVLKTSEPGRIITIDNELYDGENYQYTIHINGRNDSPTSLFQTIRFQKGTVTEKGYNGITIEDLLLICEDRLKGFQAGKFPCDENEEALKHIEAARFFLEQRTSDRIKRGVEGKHEK